VAQPFVYIDQPNDLAEVCKDFRGKSWVAVDTEFVRERTYYPQLCLIQIGNAERTVCIDPLVLPGLEPLLEILYDRSITKVLHASSQDLEIFAHLENRIPGPLFDTQLAAPLLGLPEQMGYANFVREMLGVALDKAHSRTDWSRRPLSADQLRYAADDVRYLSDLYPGFRARLEQMGRLQWLTPEFEALENIDRYRQDPDQAWLRIRGLEKLRSKSLGVLQKLACWREQVAQNKNLPRNWVLKDEVLVDIARITPENMDKLSSIRGLPEKNLSRYGKRILQLVREGLAGDAKPLPDWKRKGKKPTAQEEVLTDLLQAGLREIAARYSINSTVLANRKQLAALAQGERDIPLLRGWRREMAGLELLAIRNGERIISVENGQVTILSKNHAMRNTET
jgi:ribonuclease D